MEQCPYSGGKAVHQMNENCVQAPFRVTGAGWQMEQCPYSGGKAVYQMRVFASLFNDSILYDDLAVCLQEGLYRQSALSGKSDAKPEFTIIPNPANDQIEIKSNCSFEGICLIEITDALGSFAISEKINCKQQSHIISTSHLKQGVYFVRFVHEKIINAKQKLIIIR
jgi:hypothetical protein